MNNDEKLIEKLNRVGVYQSKIRDLQNLAIIKNMTLRGLLKSHFADLYAQVEEEKDE